MAPATPPKEILQACVRLDIHPSHAPICNGAARGKIARFFRGFLDCFLTLQPSCSALAELDRPTHQWVEEEYKAKPHRGI